jgi:glycerol-3-phosphate dehydrogenase
MCTIKFLVTPQATSIRPSHADLDVAVIGGGILGVSIALRVSTTTASVGLFEADADLAAGASKGNAGVATSYFAPPGTREASYVTTSSPRWEDICGRLAVAFRRCGALVVAFTGEEVEALRGDLELARRAGARAELVDGARARALEPLLSDRVVGALHLPDEGVIDSIGLVFATAELAALNGAKIHRDACVIGLEAQADGTTSVVTTRGVWRARFVVNAAGLGVGEVNRLAGGEPIHVTPRRGQYWVLDRAWEGRAMSTIVVPAVGPGPGTRGPQVVPTISGSILLGPTVDDVDDPGDTSTDEQRLSYAWEACSATIPDVVRGVRIKAFAANRVAIGDESAHLRRDALVPNLFLAANRAIGVSCSPAMAEEMLELLRGSGLDAPDRPDASDRLPGRALDDRDDVVCTCQGVTAGAIEESLGGEVAASSVAGVRKRTRAMTGRCQGADCFDEVCRRIAGHLECSLEDVLFAGVGTEIGMRRE